MVLDSSQKLRIGKRIRFGGQSCRASVDNNTLGPVLASQTLLTIDKMQLPSSAQGTGYALCFFMSLASKAKYM